MISLQQAAASALADYIRTNLTGSVFVDDRWPDPQRKMSFPTVTVLLAGNRIDIPLPDMNQVGQTNVGTNQITFGTQVAACEQPMQLDIWATNQIQRDDILAQLDIILRKNTITGDIEPGLLLAARTADNWPFTFFDYWFESPEVTDEPYTALVDEYHARLSGRAWGMLAVTRTTARQRLIHFKLQVQETDFLTLSVP